MSKQLLRLFSQEGAYVGPTQLFINNQYVPARSGKTFASVNPSTGKVTAQVAEADTADVEAAIDAAHTAFHTTWKATSGEKRARLMHKLADLLEDNAAELGALESLDNGMPAAVALSEPKNFAVWLRHFAGYADKLEGRTQNPANPKLLGISLPAPLGVFGATVPLPPPPPPPPPPCI